MCNCVARGSSCHGLCSEETLRKSQTFFAPGKIVDAGIKQSLFTSQYGKKFELLHDIPQGKAGTIWTTNNTDPLRAFMSCENGEGFSIERSQVSRWFKMVGEVPPVLLLRKEQAKKIRDKFFEIVRIPNNPNCCTYERDHHQHIFDSWLENFTQID